MSSSEASPPSISPKCRSSDWYSSGDASIVQIGDAAVTVRFIGRRGRRARIAIEARAHGAAVHLDTPSRRERPTDDAGNPRRAAQGRGQAGANAVK